MWEKVPEKISLFKIFRRNFLKKRFSYFPNRTNVMKSHPAKFFPKAWHISLARLGLLMVIASVSPGASAQIFSFGDRFHFNRPGNILIADQFNNRVIEVEPNGKIVWQFGVGPNDLTDRSVIGVNDAERVGNLTLISGTGLAPFLDSALPQGAVDNRVMLVDPNGKIIWQYGQFQVTGAGPNQLNTPVQSTWLPNSDVLITDQGNNRIIEVNTRKQIVWQYPGSNTNASGQLNSPNSAELLANGNILIADENNNRAIEVTRGDKIVKTFTAGGTVLELGFASRLPNGHTLLTDSGNARIVEVDTNDEPVWQFYTDTAPLSFPAPQPSHAVRLADGDTLIADQINNRVLLVNMAGDILMAYGLPLADGDNFADGMQSTQQGINWPYDAKVIGDFTGLTPPSGFGHSHNQNNLPGY
jgi:outer membrane protein assembly factor BamB